MLFGGGIVALGEEEIEHLQDQSPVSLLSRFEPRCSFLVSECNPVGVKPLHRLRKKAS